MKIKVGVSNHHIHLTKDDFKTLFNKEELTYKNELSQKGEYASNETATIKTQKSEINNVRVLGPFREYTQVEISKTDARKLGINPPVRFSGDLSDAEEITIIGPEGEITKKCCIIATRHIHISPKQKEEYGLKDIVKVRINSEKPTIIENVYLKVREDYDFELHLDTDDANASLVKQGEEAEIID